MRISEIRGEAVIDLIADIIEPVANIAQDEEIKELFKHEIVEEGTDTRAVAIERLKQHVPKIIKSHKYDVMCILATINGESVEEYAKNMSIGTLIHDVSEIFSDSELLGFFTSQVPSDTNDGTESESTSTTTEPPVALV